jgi:hypothetical protein
MDLAVTLLQDQLDEITANTRTLVQPERLAISDRAIEELMLSGPSRGRLRVGDKRRPLNCSTSPESLSARRTCFRSGRWS